MSRAYCCVWVLSGILLAGCGSPAAPLHGRWQADLSSLASDGMTGAFVSAAGLEVEFQPEGRYVVRTSFLGRGTDFGGTWKYLKSEGNVRVLEMKPDNQAASQ
jgi:hypothetical protein